MHHTLAANLAARVLAGEGELTLSGIPVASHRPNVCPGRRARLTVSCLADDVPEPLPTRVNMDAVISSAEIDVRITAASVHAPATLRWVRADGPWLHGELTLGTLQVCSVGGALTVTSISKCNAVDLDPLGARDAVAGLGRGVLASLVDGSVTHAFPSIACPDEPLRGCEHVKNRIFVVDASSVGVTLLRTTENTKRAVHIGLPRRAVTLEDLAVQLTRLAVSTQKLALDQT